MAVAFVRATYAEETNLQQFFTRLFGYGKSSVIVRRVVVEYSAIWKANTCLVEAWSVSMYDPSTLDSGTCTAAPSF